MVEPMLVALVASLSLLVLAAPGGCEEPAKPAAYVPFDGARSTWHDGFERFDYLMDGATMGIAPFPAPEGEGFGIGAPPAGGRRCAVICPKQPAPGNPWSWRGCYWDHQPQTEIALLKRGFHIAYISADATLKPDRCWDTWYAFLTEKHGLSKKPCFIGMSRGGEYGLTWATAHPTQVSAVYADNPGGNDEIFRRLPELARQDVPLLLVCGTIDPLLPRFALPFESLYQHFGGRVSLMLKEGAGHHPHSLTDPTPLADFLTRSAQAAPPATPDFVAGRQFARASYYSLDSACSYSQENGCYLARRGPAFSPCYDRYDLPLGFDVPVTILAPQKEAARRPWVLRAGFVDRNAKVDQALLAKGFHIVVGPVGYNADGPNHAEWDKLYAYLTEHGFSKTPVLEGSGGAAGAVYAWAIENPGKVSCIYAENPILHAADVKAQPLDNLEPLAKAGVPVLHLCGSQDPALEGQTRLAETRYRALKGDMKVILQEGDGHASFTPRNTQPVLDFIHSHQKARPESAASTAGTPRPQDHRAGSGGS
ncbi:MAG TPA: alpha/beta hydrolase [Armatimonadota bacterium]